MTARHTLWLSAFLLVSIASVLFDKGAYAITQLFPMSVSTLTITSVTSSCASPCNVSSSLQDGDTVSLIGVTLNVGSFAGTIQLVLVTNTQSCPQSGATNHFQILGHNRIAAYNGMPAGSYNICIMVSQPGVTNSPQYLYLNIISA